MRVHIVFFLKKNVLLQAIEMTKRCLVLAVLLVMCYWYCLSPMERKKNEESKEMKEEKRKRKEK